MRTLLLGSVKRIAPASAMTRCWAGQAHASPLQPARRLFRLLREEIDEGAASGGSGGRKLERPAVDGRIEHAVAPHAFYVGQSPARTEHGFKVLVRKVPVMRVGDGANDEVVFLATRHF